MTHPEPADQGDSDSTVEIDLSTLRGTAKKPHPASTPAAGSGPLTDDPSENEKKP
jgi:hypothetical protein